jgi:cell division protein FtsI (penicillin-binding protein 3)
MGARGNGRSPEVRRRVLLAGVLAGALLATARAFEVAVVDGAAWLIRAEDQQGDTLRLAAPRGTIYDRDGVPLAASQIAYRVAVAPREIADRARAEKLLREHLRLERRQVRRILDGTRTWVVLAGRYGVEVREALDGVRGIHFESVLQRFYPHGDVARELLGAVSLEGAALGGLELEFDSVLSGRPGRAVVRRDARGHTLPGAMLRAIEPTPGRDVYLTIDYDLQEIADQALRAALDRTQAATGELLMTDPATGDILASVSRDRGDRARNWRAATDPYEPGSTLKPFTVAGLLAHGRARLTDSIYGEQGRYQAPGRVLTDVHPHGWLSVADALRQSSNIGIAKAAARLEPEEQYLTLRDFGFGSPTGVSYPSETSGRLRRPAQWSKMSPASLAIGYEVAVTPLQMALAYGAIANGGVLLEPRLVREVRSRDGRVERTNPPRVIRRAISAEIAAALRDVLIDAVEQGTGRAAALGPFEVAGKTGTARLTEHGRYRPGAYISSFAGFFPARAPQLVFIVKLTEPRGDYFGGLAAAPVTRATLEAALATRSTPLDRGAIAAAAPIEPAGGTQVAASRERDTVPRTVVPGAAVAAVSAVAAPQHDPARAVPDVSGMPMRDGVRRLHTAGFRVRVVGSGRVRGTEPAAGTVLPGDVPIRVLGQRPA